MFEKKPKETEEIDSFIATLTPRMQETCSPNRLYQRVSCQIVRVISCIKYIMKVSNGFWEQVSIWTITYFKTFNYSVGIHVYKLFFLWRVYKYITSYSMLLLEKMNPQIYHPSRRFCDFLVFGFSIQYTLPEINSEFTPNHIVFLLEFRIRNLFSGGLTVVRTFLRKPETFSTLWGATRVEHQQLHCGIN